MAEITLDGRRLSGKEYIDALVAIGTDRDFAIFLLAMRDGKDAGDALDADTPKSLYNRPPGLVTRNNGR